MSLVQTYVPCSGEAFAFPPPGWGVVRGVVNDVAPLPDGKEYYLTCQGFIAHRTSNEKDVKVAFEWPEGWPTCDEELHALGWFNPIEKRWYPKGYKETKLLLENAGYALVDEECIKDPPKQGQCFTVSTSIKE